MDTVQGAAAIHPSIISRTGGKYRYSLWLLPQIPYCKSSAYIEPFCGSMVVLLNRPISRIELVNDLDSMLIRFMRVLQKPVERQLLIDRLSYTLYAKEEWALAKSKITSKDFIDDVDFAWAYFVIVNQSFCGKGSWGRELSVTSKKAWGATFGWFSGITHIDSFSRRISCAQIENDNALAIIKRYDSNDAIFYCDPPYLLDTRVGGAIYENEMTLEEHETLLKQLLLCKGAVCISGYPSNMYNDILQGWTLSQKEVVCQMGRNSPAGIRNDKRTECLWRNPKAMEYFIQQTLF